MATANSTQDSRYRLLPVTPALRRDAAAKLLGPNRSGDDTAAQFLFAAESHGISLDHFWVTISAPEGAVRHACLIVPGSGRSAMTFTSTPEDKEAISELAGLVRMTSEGLRGVHLVQALLEPHETAAEAALIEAGFTSVGTLAYLRRPAPTRADGFRPARAWPQGIVVRRYRSSDDPELLRGLERTYEDTLDCPELCGLRETADVLESHKAAGRFDPAHWWIVEMNRKIEGMLLLNPSPELGTIELVYLGLSCALRGRGIGRGLLEHGLSHLIGTLELHVTCAVDQRNTPAMSLYRALGFREFAARRAWVKSNRAH